MDEMDKTLLATKLYLPPQRPNLVLRPRLMAVLEGALGQGHGLILVSAKAGSGKTTLVSEWLHQQERPAAWLSLDASDNDPRRFFSYLIAALRRLDIMVDQAALSQLEMQQLPQVETFATVLINEIVTSSTPFLLVLDDYHLIQNEWIHQAIGFLAEHRPPEMHLVLLTRVDPPLSLARLRGRGQMTEIRGEDLRFTVEEATQFLNEVMELDLPSKAIATLEGRTEGWIVGLQMAAISMQGRKQAEDLTAFIDAFGGTNRFILDYLLEEVLGQQSPAIQDFLLDSSILARMCGSLCDAVHFDGAKVAVSPAESGPGAMAADQSEVPGAKADIEMVLNQGSQPILAQLARANLFVVSLDNERRWYRYHHLFADLLKSTLRQRKAAEEIRQLHRRASQWHQEEGYLEEAMIHAMAAKDYERAASMIDENIVIMLSRSEGPVLLGWMEKLPQEFVYGRPWVDVYRAYTLALSGRPDEADALLADAERRINLDTSRASELMGHIAAIRSYTANLWGDKERVIEMAALAEKYLPEDHLIARGMTAYALAVTHFADDDMESASRASMEMLRIGKKLDRLLMIVTAFCDLASMKKVRGQLHPAADYYERARRWMVRKNGLDSRVRSAYEAGLADLLYRMNRLDEAHEHALTGIAYCQRFDVPSEQVSARITLMRLFQAQGNSEGALAALRDAEQIMESYQLRLSMKIELMTARVVQWLAVGDTVTASRWAEAFDGGSEREQLALAQLLLAKGDSAGAQDLLVGQREAAEAGGRTGRLMAILSLLAMALEAQGLSIEADEILIQALSLARPEGIVRPFLDLGEPFYKLLARHTEQSERVDAQGPGKTGSGAIRRTTSYGRDLLDSFQNDRKLYRSSDLSAFSPSLDEGLKDPLTERELEVLRLLAEGHTNNQIAGRLIVAPSTVKQHLKNIYSKLDVHNRTQAVVRGRELDLL